MTVPAFPLTRILIITDAWLPQVNGVVRSIEVLVERRWLSASKLRS
jgi:hypothetical protein